MLNESSCDGCSLDSTFPPLQDFEFETVFRRESPQSLTPLGSDGLGYVSVLHLALAIVTFYRKSFTFSSHGLLCLSSGLVSLLPLLQVHSLLLPPVLTLLSLKQLLRHRHSLDFQDALNYSGMTLLLLLLSSPLSPWLLPILLSPLQLIRKPAYLLRLLRPLRVAAGPVSIVSTIAIAGGQLKQDLTLFQDSALPNAYLSIIHALSVLVLAIIAGVIFRPDNMSVLQLLVLEGKGKTEELTIVESKEGLLTVCTQLVGGLRDLVPGSVLTSYSRRVEIHALANALVLLLCLIRVITLYL